MDDPSRIGPTPQAGSIALPAAAIPRNVIDPPPAIEAAAPAIDFAAIVERHESGLLRYVAQIVGESEAQDIVQETFLRFHRHATQFGAASILSVPAWLSRVAHHLALDQVRKRDHQRTLANEKAQQMLAGQAPTQEEADQLSDLARRETADRALAELRKLPAAQQHVLLLRLIQGLKLSEISEVTGLTTGNVAYRINQALAELARRLRV